MPKTDQEKIIDALKREPFADLVALREFLLEMQEISSSAEPKDEEGAEEYDRSAMNVEAAIHAKYKDVVTNATNPPKARVLR